MKYSLWCKIFGHKWWNFYVKYNPLFEGGIVMKRDDYKEPSKFCWHCGLTKQEAGINSISTV